MGNEQNKPVPDTNQEIESIPSIPHFRSRKADDAAVETEASVDTEKTLNGFAIKDVKQSDQNKDNKPMKQKKKKNEEKLGINWVLWIGLLIVLIPCGLLAWILLSAANDTGTPILGDRFLGDLDPAIEQAQLTELEQQILGLDGVEGATVNCIVATLRINVDVQDDLSHEQISELTVGVYNAVDALLPVSSYFTMTDTKKQYDMEINVYNNLEWEDEFIMYNIVKNSGMEKYRLQDVSTPLNAELAQELRDYVIKRDEEAAKQENESENTDGESGGGESTEGENTGEQTPQAE